MKTKSNYNIQEAVVNIPVKIKFYGDKLPKDVHMEEIAAEIARRLAFDSDGRRHLAIETLEALLSREVNSAAEYGLLKHLGSRIKSRLVKVSDGMRVGVVGLVAKKRLEEAVRNNQFAIQVGEAATQ